jgi:hypothetical protein
MLADDDQALPTAFSRKWRLTFDDVVPPIELNSRIARLLSEFIAGLEKKGGTLVGHIKGLVDADEHGHLLFSVTSFEEGARFKDQMVGGISEAALTINVILYGIEEEIVERMLEEAFIRHFPGNRSRDDGGEGHAQ